MIVGGSCDPDGISPSLRALIVDDNLHFLEAARPLLEREGISVVGVATNSAEALERAAELTPDVTLVDIDLGPESGFDLAEILVGARARVVMISAYAEQDVAALVETSRAIGFLPKSGLSGRALRELLAAAAEDGT